MPCLEIRLLLLFHDCRSGIIQIPLTATENFLSFIFFPFGDLFGSSTKALAGKVQKLQNRAARVLTSASYNSITNLLWDKLG